MRVASWLMAYSTSFSRALRLFGLFIPVFILLILLARTKGTRDPGSVFFDPWTGYDSSYSSLRIEQANSYIEEINTLGEDTTEGIWKASEKPELCVGIATVARELEGAEYFKNTVATLLEGLSEIERSQIYLILFIAHTEPSDHPAVHEKWFKKLPDQILFYNEDLDIDHIRELEQNPHTLAKKKALLDYQYLLQACNSLNTPYILMVEDDVIAQDGWFHKTQEAISTAEQQNREIGASKWLYLRLFYSEEFIGWKTENWRTYTYYSVLVFFFVLFTSLGIRQYYHHSLPTGSIILLSFLITPLFIILFFATGRVTVLPIRHGVHQMPDSGCCSQAFVFPQSRVSQLLDIYHSHTEGNIDSITEAFANDHGEVRWAITPSIMQHAGRRSSKVEKGTSERGSRFKSKGEMKGSERLWNFEFELNDADMLREEHNRVKEMYTQL